MKRFVIVGLGIFGTSAAETLFEQGHEVIALDRDEARVQAVTTSVTRAVVGDGRSRDVLRQAGAEGADAAVVSMGQDLSASILAVMGLRDLGVERIYVKVVSVDHARIMNGLGVKDTVFPERESSMNLAVQISGSRSLRNYIRLGHGFSLQEMAVPASWLGKSLRELALPSAYQVSVVAIYDVATDQMLAVPDPDTPLESTFTLIVTGGAASLDRVAALG